MGVSAGIVGLPNVGKSTIFNALCQGKAQVENYPFCTIDPNHGIVAVPDQRMDRITKIIPTLKAVPAFLELIDIAGLVKGASQGEGLGNQFLGHIKEVNAIVMVVRCFDDGDVIHVHGKVDPITDISTIETELMLKDFDTVERAVSRYAKAVKTGDKEAKLKADLFARIHQGLSAGIPARKVAENAEEIEMLKELNLITAKPVLFVANVGENDLPDGNQYSAIVKEYAEKEKSKCVILCGKIETEIVELPPQDQKEFYESIGLTEPGLHVLARSVYELLGLETFFTAGEKENRAWTIPAGSTAQKAAGAIHSDFEKGFIKADVYTLEDLEKYGTETALRAAGKIRSEGREYIVKDGDIMFFKFNV